MKTLNLTDIDKSDIKYQIISYPDGQKDIVINNCLNIEHLSLLYKESVQIKSRLNNAEDLLMIICATKALRNLKVKEIHLYVPYIMGLRSDRLFQEGGNRYVKDIIAPILNMQNYESVTCYDAHSYVAENCINNLVNINNVELVKFFIKDKGIKNNWELMTHSVLVSPDAGASHKIYKLAEQIGYTGNIITCSKERNTSGELVETTVPLRSRHKSKDFILIDDICDGGRTFINIAKVIKEDREFKDSKIYLIVTHGIFSKGFEELYQYFDGIYTTNSYKENEDLIFGGDEPEPMNFIKQLNVF